MVLGALTIGQARSSAPGQWFSQTYRRMPWSPATLLASSDGLSPVAIEAMLRIAWWDWPDEKVVENGEWFMRPIHEFIEHFDPHSPV